MVRCINKYLFDEYEQNMLYNSFVKGQVTIGVLVHFCNFNYIELIHLPVTVPIPCNFQHYYSVVLLEVRDTDFPRRSFTVENSF